MQFGPRFTTSPRIGIILGSGLNDLAASVKNAVTIPYGNCRIGPFPLLKGTLEGL